MLEEEVVNNVDAPLVHKVFTATVEDGDMATKTILDENVISGIRNVLWEPGDEIGVAKYGQKYQKFVNVLEEPSVHGVFEGYVGQDVMYYAVYPYVENMQMGSPVITKIPSLQKYEPNTFDGDAAPMLGRGNDGESLHFKNLCGVLSIQMTGSEKIKSIVFQTNGGAKVSGEFTVDPDYGDYPILTMSDSAVDYVVLECGEGVQLSGTPTSFHFVLPPGKYNGFKLTIVTTDGMFMEKPTDKQLTVRRSVVTNAAPFTFENNIDDFADLSVNGTANCYLITQQGYYSFDATVIGNGASGFGANNDFHTNTPRISPVYSELLWADNHELIKGCSYDVSTGKVRFLTLGNEGNAVIAVKDSEDNILWSWHIWMTDQPEEQVYYNNAGIMMDRNLGATSATPGDVGSLGLLYQWGRKDPFLGSSSISSSVEATSTIIWPSAVSSDPSTGTIDYAISNPMTYITYNTYNYDWFYASSSSRKKSIRWQPEKTIYDPCPVGWRVPDGGDDGVWSIALGTASSYSETYDGTNEGVNFSGKLASDQMIWYPASAYRTHSDGKLTSLGGYYWSVSRKNQTEACVMQVASRNVYPSGDEHMASGLSVRCCKDVKYDTDFSVSEARGLSDEGTANSYIVSEVGVYSFIPVKGNSSESIGTIGYADVLWESNGTDKAPVKKSLIMGAKYENGRIYIKTADTFQEGNAVIAAKDDSGTVLWSWHIWLTDQPEEHIYPNNSGIMMDRNLGATSATPGDVGALGLFYQWGRKDPFLASSSISSNVTAKSRGTWPTAISSDSSTGTIDYATSHPMTFIMHNSSNGDWYYTGSSSTDNSRWQSEKTIYDPCPVGWRVPDGSGSGIWSTGGFKSPTYDTTNEGVSFSITSPSSTWYPAAGFLSYSEGTIQDVASRGYYWSATAAVTNAYCLYFGRNNNINTSITLKRSYGYSVRCFKETD